MLILTETSCFIGVESKVRYCTFISLNETDSVQCLSEDEFSDNSERINSSDEYVWQYADNKDQAIKQHYDKFDVVDDMTIVVANTDSVVLTEFGMKYHMDAKTGIRIMNVDGGCYGHDYNDPINLPKEGISALS